jgi:hypothetical protein
MALLRQGERGAGWTAHGSGGCWWLLQGALGGRAVVEIGRREVISLLGCAAAAWPLGARAQQHGMPVVGYLSVGEPPRHLLAVFKQALAESGLIEGRDVSIESSNTAEGLKAPACYSLKCSS